MVVIVSLFSFRLFFIQKSVIVKSSLNVFSIPTKMSIHRTISSVYDANFHYLGIGCQ